MKKVIFICFWDGYVHHSDILYKRIFSDTEKYDCKTIQLNRNTKIFLNEADIIICGSFISNNIENYYYKTLLSITEPIEKTRSIEYNMVKEKRVKAVLGCINNDTNKIKHPLYMIYKEDHKILEINKYIENITFEEFLNKEFCCLINKHDRGNTRSTIYNKLKGISNICCPSKLFNNYSNSEFEKEGRDDFQKRFLFGICPENFVLNDLDGYVTEKLYLTSAGGSIPIYYGKLDDIDKTVFNMDRVLLFDPRDEDSIDHVYNKVNELMNDKEKLFSFYKQKPFTDNALEMLKQIDDNYINRTKEIVEEM